jgi:predicted nucleic acid-binding protein
MESLEFADLPGGALLLIDSAPLIFFLEGHPEFGPFYRPLFEAHGDGRFRLAVTTITLAELMTGPLQSGDEALAERYRTTLESWVVVELSSDIAASAARIRGKLRLKLPDAIQAASAIAINADALVTHDRDFSRLSAIRVIRFAT